MKMRVKLIPSDLEITHVKGSGPGGQHRNKRMTGVRVIHKPTGLSVLSTERRSQEQNLHAALDRLAAKVEAFFYRPAPRHATQKTRASQVRRVDTKRRRSGTKQMRRKPGSMD